VISGQHVSMAIKRLAERMRAEYKEPPKALTEVRAKVLRRLRQAPGTGGSEERGDPRCGGSFLVWVVGGR
jgi:hypothetical protein